MNTKNLILPVFAAVLLIGCDNQNEVVSTGNDAIIDLRPGIEAISRTPSWETDGSGTFAEGDVFTLTTSDDGTYVKMLDYAMPSTTLHWEDLKLPKGTQEVSFTGCYPKHNEEIGHTFVFNINHAEDEEKDLLLAPAVKVEVGNTAPIGLPFYHAMHKLVIKYKSDNYTDEELKTIQTTPKGKAECQVDLITGKVTDISTTGLYSYTPQTGKELSVLLVPQQKSTVSLEIRIDGKTHIYKCSDLPETVGNGQDISRLEGGKQLEVVLTVNKNSITLSGITIHKWETQGSVEDDIIIG